MHDIWNPWHGCTKCSEGCQNCYMYYLDSQRGEKDSSICYRTANFNYPIQKERNGDYRIKSGESIRVAMTSDFFLSDADPWRDEAWELMRLRPDVRFYLLTKRPERVLEHLPKAWGDGWENIFFNVTCENQKRADQRIPLLLALPFKHKGIMTAPFIGPISIGQYLSSGKIEEVICGGENYDGSRPCHYEWVKKLSDECRASNVTFAFIETGTYFVKDDKTYVMKSKTIQTRQAFKSGLSHKGKPIQFKLTYPIGVPVPKQLLYQPHYRENCIGCGNRIICNGCSDCGKCHSKIYSDSEVNKLEEKLIHQKP